MAKNKKSKSDPDLPKDKTPQKDRACGGDCASPTICNDVFQGACALEIMMQEKGKKQDKPGTKGYASKGV